VVTNKHWDSIPPLDERPPIWPPTSRGGWTCDVVRDIRTGDPATESYLGLDVHIGSHGDPALHHFASGASVEQLFLGAFWGQALVADAIDVDLTSAELVEQVVPPRGVLRRRARTSSLS
jgi:kynurenine formamidase